MAAFEKARPRLEEEDISVVAGSTDPQEKAAETVKENTLTFPVAYGLPLKETAARFGAFYEERRNVLQATSFVVKPDGTIAVAQYSSGPIGRLVWQDVLGGPVLQEATVMVIISVPTTYRYTMRPCRRSDRVSPLWFGSGRGTTHSCRLGARATTADRAADEPAEQLLADDDAVVLRMIQPITAPAGLAGGQHLPRPHRRFRILANGHAANRRRRSNEARGRDRSEKSVTVSQ